MIGVTSAIYSQLLLTGSYIHHRPSSFKYFSQSDMIFGTNKKKTGNYLYKYENMRMTLIKHHLTIFGEHL